MMSYPLLNNLTWKHLQDPAATIVWQFAFISTSCHHNNLSQITHGVQHNFPITWCVCCLCCLTVSGEETAYHPITNEFTHGY
jgi:hypothetical protein